MSFPGRDLLLPLWRLCSTVAFLQLAAVAGVPAQQKIPCPEVVRELHQAERRGNGRSPSAERIARSLGTSSAWVHRCATAYGRRLDSDELASQNFEAHERNWESREAEESSREERETADDVVLDPAPYKDKARQRAFRAQEEEWGPAELDPWEPNAGREWAPYINDPRRTVPDDLEGVIRD